MGNQQNNECYLIVSHREFFEKNCELLLNCLFVKSGFGDDKGGGWQSSGSEFGFWNGCYIKL